MCKLKGVPMERRTKHNMSAYIFAFTSKSFVYLILCVHSEDHYMDDIGVIWEQRRTLAKCRRQSNTGCIDELYVPLHLRYDVRAGPVHLQLSGREPTQIKEDQKLQIPLHDHIRCQLLSYCIPFLQRLRAGQQREDYRFTSYHRTMVILHKLDCVHFIGAYCCSDLR